MKTYDRADLKYREIQNERREESAWWAQYYDLYDFFYGYPGDEDITMDDVMRGKLLTFLIKLGLKTPKEKIKHLRW